MGSYGGFARKIKIETHLAANTASPRLLPFSEGSLREENSRRAAGNDQV